MCMLCIIQVAHHKAYIKMTSVKTIIREAVVGHKGTASQKSKSLVVCETTFISWPILAWYLQHSSSCSRQSCPTIMALHCTLVDHQNRGLLKQYNSFTSTKYLKCYNLIAQILPKCSKLRICCHHSKVKMGISPPLQALKLKICTDWKFLKARFNVSDFANKVSIIF